MSLESLGYAFLTWGQPPEQITKNVEAALGQVTSSDSYYLRGAFNSPLSKALNEFMDYNESLNKEEAVCLFEFLFAPSLPIVYRRHIFLATCSMCILTKDDFETLS